jgi:flagellin
MVHSVAANELSLPGYAQAPTSVAESIAALARQSGAGRIVMFENGGVSAVNDRILALSGARLAGEAGALASATSNARYGASLLQAAQGALGSIADKLDRMKELAETIAPATTPASADGGATSERDRAILGAEFSALRSEIDAIAQSTEFDGAKILLGDGAGNALQLTFRVGAGAASADGITVAIGPATTADLSAGLATDNLASGAAAASAVTNVTAAIGQLDTIQATLRGAQIRISAAVDNARSMQAALDDALGQRGGVDITVETSRIVGEKLIDQGGLALTDASLQLFRRMLLNGANETSRPDEGPAGARSDGAGAGVGQSGRAQTRQSEPAE